MIDRSKVMPLESFPAAHRSRIQELVARDRPPPRELSFRDSSGRVYCSMPSRAFYEWYWQRGREPDQSRPKVSPRLRRDVVATHGMVCHLCGSPIEADDLHIDHVKPVSVGGATVAANLRPAHATCNLRKGNRWIDA